MTTHEKDSVKPETTPTPHTPDSQPEATVDLAMQIERALSAFVRGGNPTQELTTLDQLYAAHSDAAQVERTALELFRQPAAFDNLNFHSSLLTSGSNFFGLVLRRMGELVDAEPALAEGAALPVLIRLTEHFRRKGDHARMEHFAACVEAQLETRVEQNDPLALNQLAKVRYEQSMGHFNQKQYARAITVGEESVNLSERAGDQFGVLAARGNTAGLFRYEWVRDLGKEHPESAHLLAEGRPVLEADLETAQQRQTKQEAGSLEGKKFARVEMNNAAHLMHVADLQGDIDLARKMMQVLQQNAIYQEAFDPQHPGDPTHAQAWARPYPEILARLEVSASQKSVE